MSGRLRLCTGTTVQLMHGTARQQAAPNLSVTVVGVWAASQRSGALHSVLQRSFIRTQLGLTSNRSSDLTGFSDSRAKVEDLSCARDTIRAPRASQLTPHRLRTGSTESTACSWSLAGQATHTRPCRPSDGRATCHHWVRLCSDWPRPPSVTHGFHDIHAQAPAHASPCHPHFVSATST